MAGQGRHNADEELALALAKGITVTQAASQAGISLRTATRRVADPDFKRQVQSFRSELIQQASARLVGGMVGAADTLANLLGSSDEKIQLQAAKILLEQSIKLAELADLDRRLSELEDKVSESDNAENAD